MSRIRPIQQPVCGVSRTRDTVAVFNEAAYPRLRVFELFLRRPKSSHGRDPHSSELQLPSDAKARQGAHGRRAMRVRLAQSKMYRSHGHADSAVATGAPVCNKYCTWKVPSVLRAKHWRRDLPVYDAGLTLRPLLLHLLHDKHQVHNSLGVFNSFYGEQKFFYSIG